MAKASNARESISQQVARVKAEVDRLNTMMARFDPDLPPVEISPQWIRGTLEGRRRREKIFSAAIFGDAGWDILLELYARKLEGARATISDVCTATAVPYTTALNWVARLEREGLLVRRPDTEDLRRVFVELTERATAGMDEYFGDVPAEPAT